MCKELFILGYTKKKKKKIYLSQNKLASLTAVAAAGAKTAIRKR